MSLSRLFFASALLTAFSIASSASTIIPGDPDIALDAGNNSTALTTNTDNLIVGAGGGGVFGYYNSFGEFITSVTFQVTIGKNQDLTFGCESGFFLTCKVIYDPPTGLVTMTFKDVNTDDSSPDDFGDDEAGEQEGIPPLLPGCLSTPDAPGCNDVGHFIITLNDGFATSGDNGGWPAGAQFQVTDIGVIPEPSTGILFGSVLLIGVALAGIRARRVRRA